MVTCAGNTDWTVHLLVSPGIPCHGATPRRIYSDEALRPGALHHRRPWRGSGPGGMDAIPVPRERPAVRKTDDPKERNTRIPAEYGVSFGTLPAIAGNGRRGQA